VAAFVGSVWQESTSESGMQQGPPATIGDAQAELDTSGIVGSMEANAASTDAAGSNKILIYGVTTPGTYRHAAIGTAATAIAQAAMAVGLTSEIYGTTDATNIADPTKFTAAALAKDGAVILISNDGEPFGYRHTRNPEPHRLRPKRWSAVDPPLHARLLRWRSQRPNPRTSRLAAIPYAYRLDMAWTPGQRRTRYVHHAGNAPFGGGSCTHLQFDGRDLYVLVLGSRHPGRNDVHVEHRSQNGPRQLLLSRAGTGPYLHRFARTPGHQLDNADGPQVTQLAFGPGPCHSRAALGHEALAMLRASNNQELIGTRRPEVPCRATRTAHRAQEAAADVA
jgi:hypothetical protein